PAPSRTARRTGASRPRWAGADMAAWSLVPWPSPPTQQVVNGLDRGEREQHDGDDFEKEHHRPSVRFLPLALRWKLSHGPLRQRLMREGNTDSPESPEKIELVSDGTRSTPTVNVTRIITAWTPYKS